MAEPESETGRRLRERAGPGAIVARAPGRVNLVGEHTDYNDGFVLPVAIDRSTWVAARPRDDAKLVMRSGELAEIATVDLRAVDAAPRRGWSDYPHGIARALRRAGVRIPGADLAIASDVPIGAGLSSSAALLVATGRALLALVGEAMAPEELAALCREAENEFVGARSGIMDPMVSLLGEPGAALLLDCRSLAHRAVALPPDLAIVVCDTGVRHALASGEYNRRRAECEEGVAVLASSKPEIAALRDATEKDLARAGDRLAPVIRRRCRHVLRENLRVPACADALGARDLARVARLLAESHASLRDDFEASCPELDLLVESAAGLPGVHGSRMTGGGFGGCTVHLVERASVDAFRHRVAAAYRRGTGRVPGILVCRAAGGAAHDPAPGSGPSS